METHIASEATLLYQKACIIIDAYLKESQDDAPLQIPEEFKKEFFSLIDKVNLSLMEDTDNFYGYFFFQMGKEIRFDISSPTAVHFKGAKYVIYFNPVIFLILTGPQMESSIKHEILHIVSLHLLRARELRDRYSKLALNMAMDVVVNTYLDHLPPYATTLSWVNMNYSLTLPPFESFEYYVEKIQTALDLRSEKKDLPEDDSIPDEKIKTSYDPQKTHDIWESSDEVDAQTLQKFTEKYVDASQKGQLSNYLESMIDAMKDRESELPWNLYLKKILGTVAIGLKKTTARRNRRQPERLDLPGRLRAHRAKIFIALDISGSISNAEFKQAMQEVFRIVKNYNHEITIIECDDEIRRTYRIHSIKDIKNRLDIRGGTKFSPVFDYANGQHIDLLVYFTDGKGEDRLLPHPKGYKILWVLSGKSDFLSVKEACGTIKKLKPVKAEEDPLDMTDIEKGGYSMNNQEKISMDID
jgi:predicted metal-dependent peptidase